MTGARDIPYTRMADAVSLHEMFVANVRAIMTERGHVYDKMQGGRVDKVDYKWLAQVSGIPYRTIENLMTLNNQPTMVGAAKIAKALGVSLDSLLGQPTFGMSASQQVVVNGVEHGASTSPTLECIHAKPDGERVCPACLAKWQDYQQRLRLLYETRRQSQRADWQAENTNVRAEQLRTANLPKDTDER